MTPEQFESMTDEELCAHFGVSDPQEARFIGALEAGIITGDCIIVDDDQPAGDVERTQALVAPEAEEPIGTVTWGEGPARVATLLGVDRWRVMVGDREDPIQARALEAIYKGEYRGPSDGYYGQAILQDLARETGGKMTWLRPLGPALPPGEQSIY